MQNENANSRKMAFICMPLYSLSIKTIGPIEELYICCHHKIPIQVMSLAKCHWQNHPSNTKLQKNHLTVTVLLLIISSPPVG